MPDQELELKIIFDEKGAVVGVEKINKAVGKSSKKMKDETKKSTSGFKSLGNMMKIAAGSFIATRIVRGLKDVFMAASNAQETISKFNTVFKDVQKEADKVAANLSTNFGLSSVAAKQLLGDTGDLLSGFGFTGKAALDLAKKSNELAVDLASFTNFAGGAEGASIALTKAMLGESEQAKALGIVIRQDSDEYKTLVKHYQDTEGASLLQAKALTALQIATNQSKNAVGDFARTQAQTANQLRISEGRIDDIKVALGQNLLPVFTPLIAKFNELTSESGEWMQWLKTAPQALEKVAKRLREFVGWIKTAPLAFERLGLRTRLWFDTTVAAIGAVKEAFKGDLRGGIKEASQKYADAQLEFKTKDAELQLAMQETMKVTAEVAKQTSKEVKDKREQDIDKVTAKIALTKEERKEMEKLTKEELFMDEDKKLQYKIDRLNKFKNEYALSELQLNAITKAINEYTRQQSEITKQKRIADLQEYLALFSQATTIAMDFGTVIHDLKMQQIEDEKQAKLDQLDTENEFADALAELDAQALEDKKQKLRDEIAAALAANNTELADELSLQLHKIELSEQAAERDKEIADETTRIEKEAARDKAVVARKLAIMKKIASAFKITADTAAGMVSAFVPYIPFISEIRAGIVAAAGAAQGAALAAAPLPEVPAMAFGGTLGGRPGNDTNMFKGSRGETVLNTSQGQNLFNSLESAGLLGGGQVNNSMTNDNRNLSKHYSIGTVINQGGNEFDEQVSRRRSEGGDFN
jgi:hypothetical protein